MSEQIGTTHYLSLSTAYRDFSLFAPLEAHGFQMQLLEGVIAV